MQTIRVKPIEIIGTCPAGLELTSEFDIEGMNIRNYKQSELCFESFCHLAGNIWWLRSGKKFFIHVSCPGCIADMANENRVVFLLGRPDKWELGEVFTEYWKLRRKHGEPEEAKQLRLEAEELEREGNRYSEVLQKLRAALEVLRSSI
jgi:hypothetical protein